jgi:hypothetical protein
MPSEKCRGQAQGSNNNGNDLEVNWRWSPIRSLWAIFAREGYAKDSVYLILQISPTPPSRV